jgi:hypothetical protein
MFYLFKTKDAFINILYEVNACKKLPAYLKLTTLIFFDKSTNNKKETRLESRVFFIPLSHSYRYATQHIAQ